MANIGIVGAGFVGEAVGFGMKTTGHFVVMYDINKARLHELSDKGYVVEEDLECLVMATDYIFVQVPTPSTKDGVDLKIINKVVDDLKKILAKSSKKYLIFKSTIPPGTTREIAEDLGDKARVCFCPEFLQEKTAAWDFLNPDRIVLGGPRDVTEDVAKLFVRFKTQIIQTSYEAAEMCKYASNNWFATNISFWNDITKVCRRIGVDEREVHKCTMAGKFFGTHPWKIGEPFGGHCLPKDNRALIAFAESKGVTVPTIKAAEQTNVELGGFKHE